MKRRPLALLLGSFLLLGLVYSLTTPLFEAPDEVWHYAYVRYLAEGHGLPSMRDNASGAYQEVAQPPLYYLVAAAVSRWVDDGDLPDLMWHNPGFGYQAGGTVNDNKNMLIHTARERFPWRGAVLAPRVPRPVSLGFGLLALLAVHSLGRAAFPDRPALAWLTAATVAFMPQFLFLSGVVSNDSAAAALSTLALARIARLVRGERGGWKGAGVTGLVLGLAILTKVSALLLLPLALIALVVAGRQQRSEEEVESLRRWVAEGGVMVAVALAVGGWWYLRNGLLYGDPLGIRVHVGTPWGRPAPVSLIALLPELPRVYRSFWGAFGWGHVEFPPAVYLLLGGLVVLALVGWGLALIRRRPARWLRRGWPIFLLALVWWGLVFAALLRWMQQVEAPHGRLLFPALGAWALLLVGGWAALADRLAPHLPRGWTPSLPFAPLALLVPLALAAPFAIIRPAFAPPRLLPPERAKAAVTPTDLVYSLPPTVSGEETSPVARLLGVALDREVVTPGAWLTVRACWEGLAPMEEDYTVFVHLLGRENRRVAERNTYPGLGRFPTSLWPVGRAFCDDYRLRVEPWAPVPERYDVEIGLYRATDGARLPVHNAAGFAVAPPIVASVRVVPPRPLAVRPQRETTYRLGEAIALVGYDLAGRLEPGAAVTLTLYWRAEGVPEGDYTVFVHLLDRAGEMVAQHDSPPRYGRYPTVLWRAGDVVPDDHPLTVPADAVGPFRLRVGLYRPDTLERLPVSGPEGSLPDRAILLSP